MARYFPESTEKRCFISACDRQLDFEVRSVRGQIVPSGGFKSRLGRRSVWTPGECASGIESRLERCFWEGSIFLGATPRALSAF
jgi:hypothetical protein